MADLSLRKVSLYAILILLLFFDVYMTSQWSTTFIWKDIDGTPIRPTYSEGWTIFWSKPLEMLTYSGWGAWFQWNLLGLTIITMLYLLEGAPKSYLYEIPDPRRPDESRFDFILVPRWRNRIGGYMPVELRLPTLIWVLASDLFMLAVVGTGASMNLFWDFQHATPYYPWHLLAHGFISAVVMNKVLSINMRGIFGCSWKWQELICYAIAWGGSMWNEVKENLIALLHGQLAWMNNVPPDSIGDHLIVMVAAVVAVRIFIGIQYHD